jgi:tetratricopeptide (TPR) repeat protein
MTWGVTAVGVACLLASAPALDGEQLVTAGEAYVEAGQAKKARPVLQRALQGGKLNPAQQARAHCALGMAASQLGDPDGAVASLEESIRLDGSVEKPYLVLGMTHDMAERYQEARKTYERGVARFPKSVPLLRELGATELLLGDAHAAVGHLASAVARDNEDSELMRDYGEALLRTGQAQKAVKVLEEARALDAENPHLAATLGDALVADGRARDALRAYDRAVALDPGHAPAWFHKGLVLAREGDVAGAVVAYRAALKADPGNLKARAALGVALGKTKGQEDEAIAVLREVVGKDPGYAEAHAQLGLLLERRGDLPGAEAALSAAASRRQQDPSLWENVARVQQKRGLEKDAAQSLENAKRARQAKGGK